MSLRQLEALAGRGRGDLERLAGTAGRFYHPFDVAQRKGAVIKWRHIDNPTDTLKKVQRNIQRRILASFPFPDRMFGGVAKKSIRDNAELHVRKSEVVTLDLADCFPNIDHKRVYAAYRSRLGCSSEIASMLTRLTTFQGRVPQGAPTSPLLANLVMVDLYEDVATLCTQANLQWSFFVDDIAISGDGAWKVIEPVIRAIEARGFCVSARKVCIMPAGEQQEVTGTVVNRKVSVGWEYIESVRDEIYRISHRGEVTERELQRVGGRIAHVTHVCPPQGRALRRHFDRWMPLHAVSPDATTKRKPEIRDCPEYVRSRHIERVASPAL